MRKQLVPVVMSVSPGAMHSLPKPACHLSDIIPKAVVPKTDKRLKKLCSLGQLRKPPPDLQGPPPKCLVAAWPASPGNRLQLSVQPNRLP